MVILSHDIAATDGSTLRDAGYSFQFWTRAQFSKMNFTEVGQLSVRGGGPHTQAYGGFASDLNGDRFLDVTIVNEVSADLRVFLNKADGGAEFYEFLDPPSPVGDIASPSETSDFNRDGFVDVCVANIADNTVSILLGNGDGTFDPQEVVAVGVYPRGITVLDVDGDGDPDIVNTNFTSGNLTLLINDGTGSFPDVPIEIEAGMPEEYAIAAADMNNDGILDLVVGSRSTSATPERFRVLLGNGDGTFTLGATQQGGGGVWMLGCGDLNGDGNEDVAAVHPFNNRGTILLGDGAGNLASPVIQLTDVFPLATDLGDLDGDGDLDWVTSSYSGDWLLFRNDGSGNFTFAKEFPSPIAASCSLPFDADNNGTLDLALIDEEADVVIIMRNSEPFVIPAASSFGLLALAAGVLMAGGAIVCGRHRKTSARCAE